MKDDPPAPFYSWAAPFDSWEECRDYFARDAIFWGQYHKRNQSPTRKKRYEDAARKAIEANKLCVRPLPNLLEMLDDAGEAIKKLSLLEIEQLAEQNRALRERLEAAREYARLDRCWCKRTKALGEGECERCAHLRALDEPAPPDVEGEGEG